MNAKSTRMHWSSRVPLHKIRRLYESDARGLLNEELLDDVGHALFARCRDILDISQTQRGKVKCPQCGHTIQRRQGKRVRLQHLVAIPLGGESERLRCERCGSQLNALIHSASRHGGGQQHLFFP